MFSRSNGRARVTPRVMRKLALDYPVLQEVNPRVVLVSIASQGLTGPERDYVSVDPILQALGGVASLTGRPEAPPQIVTMYADPLAAVHAAGGVLAGLLVPAAHRSRRPY